jgi:hypothetical protein
MIMDKAERDAWLTDRGGATHLPVARSNNSDSQKP